ncbi:nitroreductase family protein [Mycobacterium sp. RTGN5]|uniref:nitroreductase family protein n=1 Tax=Mycobacterium sp. RTGN5 TaxID=3016522 RepID=UPI0029C8D75D|nr:nitroreductase family protein [Mycobacterium sp. RTGN5]
MSSQFPDADTVRTVLTLAARAPSVHNSQPWRWRVGPDGLHLYADPSRQLPKTDPDRRDLLASCGAALHHCAVALAALGWQAQIRRFPNPADRDHLASIEVHRQRAGDLDITLAAAITRRRTDRRNYSAWPVPGGDIALMGARAARAGVMLRQIDLLPHLTAIFAQSVDDNAGLIALGTETDDDMARLRAGEATSLVLLSATAMGLATCPVTEPLEIAETREAVRADVFGTSGYPQMMLRVGWAAVGADPLPATPRRPLSEMVG